MSNLETLSTVKSIRAIAIDWLAISALVILGESIPAATSLAQFGIGVFLSMLIATRQHALLIMMHEGAHGLLSPSQRANDWISDLFCAMPFFTSTKDYRDHHLRHHRFLNGPDDPDWVHYLDFAKQMPVTPFNLFRIFVQLTLYKSLHEFPKRIYWFLACWPDDFDLRSRKALSLCAFGTTLLLFPIPMLKYWIAPLLLFYPALSTLRGLSEHVGIKSENAAEGTREVLATKLEAFTLSPHNVGLHHTHHLNTKIPFYNLSAFRDELIAKGQYPRTAAVFHGYLPIRAGSVIESLIRYDQ